MRKQLDQELSKSEEASNQQREQRAAASLNNIQSIETDLYKGRVSRAAAMDKEMEKSNNQLYNNLSKNAQAYYSGRIKDANEDASRQKKISDDHLAYSINNAKQASAEQETLRNKTFNQIEQYERKLDKLYNRPAASSQLGRQINAGQYSGLGDKELNTLKQKATEVDAVMKESGSGAAGAFWGSFQGAFIGILTGMALGVILSGVRTAVNEVRQAIVEGMNFQKEMIALRALSNTAGETASQITLLDNLSRNTPNLSFDTAIEGEKRLRAVGFSARQATDSLLDLAKLRIMSGGSKEDLLSVVNIYERIDTLGKVTDRDLRQLVAAMPAYGEVIRKVFGTSSSKMLKDLSLSSSEFFELVHKEIGSLPQPVGGAADALEKLENSYTRAEHAFVGFNADGTLLDGSLLNTTEVFFQKLTVAIDDNKDVFMEWGRAVNTLLQGLSAVTNSTTLRLLLRGSQLTLLPQSFLPQYQGHDVTSPSGSLLTGQLNQSSIQSQLKDAKDLQEMMKITDEASAAISDKQLSDYEVGLNKRQAEQRKYYGLSANEQLRYEIDSKDLEREAIDERTRIRIEAFDQQIQWLRDAGQETTDLEERKQNFLTLLTRENEAKRTQIVIDENKKRIEADDALLSEFMKGVTSRQAISNAGVQGQIASIDTSTPSGVLSSGRRGYSQQLVELQQQRDALATEYRGKISNYRSGREHDGLPVIQADLNSLQRSYETADNQLVAATQKLAASREGQARNESRSALSLATANANVRAFFGGLREIEGGGLLTVVGGGHANANDPRHPGEYGMGGMYPTGPGGKLQRSTAAGNFQETLTNWNKYKKELNLTDFRDPEQQFRLAVRLAMDAGGPGALDDIMAGNFTTSAAKRSTQPWAASPFSTLRGHKRNDFLSVVQKQLGIQGTGVDTVALSPADVYAKHIANTPAALQLAIDTQRYQQMTELFDTDNTQKKLAEALNPSIMNQITAGHRTVDLIKAGKTLDARKLGFGPETTDAKAQQRIDKSNAVMDLDKEFALIQDLNAAEESNLKIKAQRNANAKASVDLAARVVGFETEITQAVEAQKTAKVNEQMDLNKEYRLTQALDVSEESRLALSKLRNANATAGVNLAARQLGFEQEIGYAIEKQATDLKNGVLDVERDIAVLHATNANTSAVSDRRRIGALQEELSLEQEIAKSTDEIANAGKNDDLFIRNELLKQQVDIQHENRNAIVDAQKAEVEINNMLQIRGTVIYGKIMSGLAQQKNMETSIADGVLGVYNGIAGSLDKLIDKGTKHLGVFASLPGEILKTTGRSVLTNVTHGILDRFGLGGWVDKATTSSNPVVAGLQKQDKQIDLLTKIESNTRGGPSIPGFGGATSRFKLPFGLGSGGGLFGGSGIGPGGTPFFNPGGGGATPYASGLELLNASPLPGQFGPGIAGGGGGGGGILNLLFGKGGFGAIRGGLGAALPGLGLSLGSMLGGKSMLGSILGGVGGLGIGLAGLTALAPGTMGALLGGIVGPGLWGPAMALLSNPITAVVGGALLVGALILNRNAKRREAEKQRAGLLSAASGDFDKLISQVRGRHMSGADALAQADQIRTKYTEQVATLKDAKTRRIAMNEWNPPNLLWAKMESLKREAEIAGASDEREKRIIPEFATGGRPGDVLDLTNFRRRNGRIGGMRSWGDVVPAMLTPQEMVINEVQQRRIQMIAGPDVFNRAQIPGYEAGRAPQAAYSTASTDQPQITLYVTTSIDAEGMVTTALRADGVKAENLRIVQQGIKDRQITMPQRNITAN